MELTEGKIVFAPLGADTFGEDVLLFEHGLLFALETVVEMADGLAFADVHAQLGGDDKRERPVEPLSEADVRALASRAECDVFFDGMLTARRHPETNALAQIAVLPRLFFPRRAQFEAPDGFSFGAFFPDGSPDVLSLDFDLFIALQYRLCETLMDALGRPLPLAFTTESLQITASWPAYVAFLKGKRLARTPELKLGWYEQAIGQDGQFFQALINAATLFKTQTDYQTARKRFGQAAAATQDPAQRADVYFEMGLCSIYLGDPKTARRFWEQALEFGADNPSLYVNMAGTYEQEENLPEAVRLNEMAVEKFPDFHKAVVNLARLQAMRGNMDAAIALYERALELQPNDALRRAVLGGCYLAVGRTDDARRQFASAVSLDASSEPGQYARAELEKLGPGNGEDGEPKKKRWGLF